MNTRSVLLVSALILFPVLTGCSSYHNIRAGSIMEVTNQETLTPIKAAGSRKSSQPLTPVIEQETVIVPPLEEAPPPPDYVVGPNDVLFINVNGKPEFSSAYGATIGSVNTSRTLLGNRVDGNGNIQFPFFGTVKVGGMTLVQIQKRIRELLLTYIKEPWVLVEVVDYKSHPLYLLGQFKNSGIFYMDRPLNVLQGIALGNGYDSTANISGARLIRDKKVMPVDVHDLLTKGDQRQNVWLKPGDTIYIPDNKDQMVFVFGAVKTAGPVPIPSAGLTLGRAIASAGLNETGYDSRHVRIIRSLSATRGELIVVDFERMLQGETLPFMLREGDIVLVPKSGLGNWNDSMNEILPTLQVFSALLSPFVSIKYLTHTSY